MRTLTNQAQNAVTNAGQSAGTYGSQAGTMFGSVAPTVSQWAAGNTPGYGSLGLAQMLNSNEMAAAAARGSGDERARLLGARTGNAASVAPVESGVAGQTGRTASLAIQNALTQNAQLKAKQQQDALGLGSSLYGTAGRIGLGFAGQQAPDINAGANANKTGWFQNALGLVSALSGASKGPMAYA